MKSKKDIFSYEINLAPLLRIPQEIYKDYILTTHFSSQEVLYQHLNAYRATARIATAIAIPAFVHAIYDLQAKKIYTHGFGTWWRINPRTAKLKQRLKKSGIFPSASDLLFKLKGSFFEQLKLPEGGKLLFRRRLWGKYIQNLQTISLLNYSKIVKQPERYLFIRSGTLIRALDHSVDIKSKSSLVDSLYKRMADTNISGKLTFKLKNLKPPYSSKKTYSEILIFHRVGAKTRLRETLRKEAEEARLITRKEKKQAEKVITKLMSGSEESRLYAEKLLKLSEKIRSEKQLDKRLTKEESELKKLTTQLFTLKHLYMPRQLKRTTKMALVVAYRRKYGVPKELTLNEFATIPEIIFSKPPTKFVIRQITKKRTLISKKTKYKSTFKQRYFMKLMANLPRREFFLTRDELWTMYKATREETYNALFEAIEYWVRKISRRPTIQFFDPQNPPVSSRWQARMGYQWQPPILREWEENITRFELAWKEFMKKETRIPLRFRALSEADKTTLYRIISEYFTEFLRKKGLYSEFSKEYRKKLDSMIKFAINEYIDNVTRKS